MRLPNKSLHYGTLIHLIFDVTSIPLQAVKSEYGGAAAAKEELSILNIPHPTPLSYSY